MFKLNPESQTGFPWSFFVGQKKKIGPSSHTQTTENISASTDTINPLPEDQASLALACFVLRSSGILLSECFGFFQNCQNSLKIVITGSQWKRSLMRSGKCCDFISCLRFTYLATHSCAHKPPRHPNHYSNRLFRICPYPHPARKSLTYLDTHLTNHLAIRRVKDLAILPANIFIYSDTFLCSQTPTHPTGQLFTNSQSSSYLHRHPPIYPNTYSSIQTHNHAHSNSQMHLSWHLLTLSLRKRSSIYPDTH